MKVSVIGAGAVGAFYGAKLQTSGLNVEYYSKTLAKHAKNKIKIKSIWGDFEIQVKVFSQTTGMSLSDLVIISTKVTNLQEDAKKILVLIQPIIHEKTILLFLQNGINMEETISKKIKNPILGGLAFTCINRRSPNVIHHLDYGLVKIGALNSAHKKIAREVVNLFQNAKIEVQFTNDLRRSRFEKLLWNVPFNSLSVICNTNTKILIQNQNIKKLCYELMNEVRMIANHEGKKITQTMIKEMIQRTENMQPYKTSMLLDYESKKKMEVDAILGQLVSLAKKYKLFTPHLNSIYAILDLYNQQIEELTFLN